MRLVKKGVKCSDSVFCTGKTHISGVKNRVKKVFLKGEDPPVCFGSLNSMISSSYGGCKILHKFKKSVIRESYLTRERDLCIKGVLFD